MEMQSWLQIRRQNIKTTIIQKLIYKLNALIIKIPITIFFRSTKADPEIHMDVQWIQANKNSLAIEQS